MKRRLLSKFVKLYDGISKWSLLRRTSPKVGLVVFAGVFALGGVLLLHFTGAATFFRSLEAENSTMSGNVSTVSDDGASGGSAIQFGTAGSSGSMRSSIEQYGITWTFDKAYPAGQFVNGDWWVVGPVKVTSISPEWDGTRHGSMVNPRPSESHGYYNGVHGYSAALNVGDEVANGSDLTLAANSSLISTRGWAPDEPGAPTSNGTIKGVPRPALRDAAVLTVLGSPAPNGSLRPPFGYGDKPLYNISQIRWDKLPSLEPPSNRPTWGSLERIVERPWIDHKPYWVGTQYTPPTNNFSGYGREFSRDINGAILALMFNDPQSAKEKTMYGALQIGIDLHGVIQHTDGVIPGYGNAWYGEYGGGHGSGRKWPILFAGIMLNDQAMMNIGKTYGREKWQEDCQTVINTNPFGNNPRPIGSATWGDRNCTRPNKSDYWDFNNSYRWCCSATSWTGSALGARIMGAKELWNYDPFFDYMDFYINEPGLSTAERSNSQWQKAMWDMYRSKY